MKIFTKNQSNWATSVPHLSLAPKWLLGHWKLNFSTNNHTWEVWIFVCLPIKILHLASAKFWIALWATQPHLALGQHPDFSRKYFFHSVSKKFCMFSPTNLPSAKFCWTPMHLFSISFQVKVLGLGGSKKTHPASANFFCVVQNVLLAKCDILRQGSISNNRVVTLLLDTNVALIWPNWVNFCNYFQNGFNF